MMFSKVLVANRGEIAVRVIRTLQAMGITTVAVYSEPDASAPHVMLADEALPLGGRSAEESYLDRRKIIGIAQRCGAEAIHPGYGFLAESPDFSRECSQAGLAFVGPGPETIDLLGDKIRSKDTAIRAGVPVVPSSPLWQPGITPAEKAAEGLGFPLLVKSAAGGGGKGIRIVERPQDLDLALESASREATSSFGDGRVFLERYIPEARHIEFQVLADSFGNTVHLLERECSLQRRYQKVIEETPSPTLDEGLRRAMAESAVAMAKLAGYINVGTVEFLLDSATREYYFLEMNARIQVEHPVTEETLNLDIVELQMRVAAGEPLTLTQGDIMPTGHAIECRIYAEDTYGGFIPSTGRLLVWRPPSGKGIRLDSGVNEGQEITEHYDAMLAKLIVWHRDRAGAIRRMSGALKSFPVAGVSTNIPFLLNCLAHPSFQSGEYGTGFVDRHPESREPGPSVLAAAIAERFRQSGNVGTTRQATRPPTSIQGPWDGLTKMVFP